MDKVLRDLCVKEILESIGTSYTLDQTKNGLRRGATNAVENIGTLLAYDELCANIAIEKERCAKLEMRLDALDMGERNGREQT